ncbi:ROK family protein [Paenibacillus nasutitermitis]|uniref:Glucokinase n=1 Tax=Paenibacillus nasutitermitis TaxID=1652958 RepID=A0A916YSD3_9BACL|nr:ROK family protein [Paenibacillus nasutitermitis]GGD59311.1 glucokinase [Paenibacillus nasutitermitis]
MGIYSHDPASLYAIGVDIGGTKINAGIISHDGKTLYSESLPTRAGESPVVERIAIAVSRLLAWAYGNDPRIALRGIGIGTAGQVDWQTGTIRHASELLPGYTGTPLKAFMEQRFGMPVHVDNDVNVLALAELYAGAGKDIRQMICLALGTGIGGVIVDDGKIMHGKWGGAGEIGHMSIDFRGLPCICGSRGCLEAYASGTSIAKRMNERLAERGTQASDGPRNTRGIIASWLSGDPDATAIMDDAFEALGAAIASLLHICNPELIIIGGGLADVGEPLLRRIEEETHKRAMSSFQSGVRILPSSHGSLGGMIGAAMQLWEYE